MKMVRFLCFATLAASAPSLHGAGGSVDDESNARNKLPSAEEIAAARPTTPPPTPPPAGVPDSAPLIEHLKLLREFLDLPPGKLENIRKTIAVIEGMDESERARLRASLKRIQLDLENTGETIGDLASELTTAEKKAFKRYWLSLPPPRRKSIEGELASLSPSEQTEALRRHISLFTRREAHLLEAFRAKSAAEQ